MADAVPALGPMPRRVFLTIGRLELAPFAATPQHFYLVRSIEPIGDALPAPHVQDLRARGPFDEAAERALLKSERIDIIVTKNSGGSATYAKIAAARALGLPVVVVTRPEKPRSHRSRERRCSARLDRGSTASSDDARSIDVRECPAATVDQAGRGRADHDDRRHIGGNRPRPRRGA